MPSTASQCGTRAFALLWTSAFLFYLSFQVVIPIVPLFSMALGAREAQVGLIVGAFAVSAMVVKVFAGQVADSIGRRPLLLLGALIFAFSSFAYTTVAGVAALVTLRLFHGIGMGCGQTATATIAADLAPEPRRAETLAIFGLTATVAMAIGPYLGIELYQRWGTVPVFMAATAVSVGAVSFAAMVPETGLNARASLRLRPFGLSARSAVYPASLFLALYFGYGGVTAFLPSFAEREHLGSVGLFYTVFALAAIAVRYTAGRTADRIGRRIVIVVGLGLTGAALATLAMARSPNALLVSAVLYGLGLGFAQPGLVAMTVDRAPPEERGRAMGTFYTALEVGIFTGAILLGILAQSSSYRSMWWAAASVCWLAMTIAAIRDESQGRAEAN